MSLGPLGFGPIRPAAPGFTAEDFARLISQRTPGFPQAFDAAGPVSGAPVDGLPPFSFGALPLGQGAPSAAASQNAEPPVEAVPLPPARPSDDEMVQAPPPPSTSPRLPAFGFGGGLPARAADVPAPGAQPIVGRAPADLPAPNSPGPAAAQAAVAPPADPAAAAEPSMLDRFGAGFKRFGENGGNDTLIALGTGLMSTHGFGNGLSAGFQNAQVQEGKRAATDLARAEYGLKAQKLARDGRAENVTAKAIADKLSIPLDQAVAFAGNPSFVTSFLSGNYGAPEGFTRTANGLVPVTGGPQDVSTLRARAQAQAEGAAAGKPDEPYNLSPGQTRFDASGSPIVSVPDRSKAVEQSSSIRKEIHTLPSYKNYSQALPVYQGMLETADRNSKASDLNLIYGLGKIMDPGSVVREGELRLAQDTQGVADKLIGMYNSVSGGARLSPQARQQLLSEAYGRIQSYEQSFGQDRRGYEGIVARQGMNADDVLPNFAPARPYQPPQKAPAGGPPSRAELEAEARRRRLLP